MIICRTPFRISFAGGGTDFSGYYSSQGGAVLSTAIDKYMYVTINRKLEGGIRVGYTKTENVDSVDEIAHDLVREALKKTGVLNNIEVTTMADIPAGTGLGSSSSLTVGLLNALYFYQGKNAGPERLAREACEIEIDTVGEPIGKQDQYIAAYGGINNIVFNKDESVDVCPVNAKSGFLAELQKNLLLLYTGVRRRANTILAEQQKDIKSRFHLLDGQKKVAEKLIASLRAGELETFGKTLDEAWSLKRQMSHNVSNPAIDGYYSKAKDLGALGGKILGAGGGGFLLLYAPPERHEDIKSALKLRELQFKFEAEGSKIVFAERNGQSI